MTVDLFVSAVLELVEGLDVKDDPLKEGVIKSWGRREEEIVAELVEIGCAKEVTLQILASLANKGVIEKVLIDRFQQEPRWKKRDGAT